MQKFVVGFIFSKNFEKVLLIHKNTPEWQKGLVNGLGGKVEEGEDSFACVRREIREESGLDIGEDKWTKAGVVHSPTFTMDVFGTVYDGSMNDAKTIEDEEIEWFPVNNIPANVIENIPWMMHLSLDKIKNENYEQFEVKYKK